MRTDPVRYLWTESRGPSPARMPGARWTMAASTSPCHHPCPDPSRRHHAGRRRDHRRPRRPRVRRRRPARPPRPRPTPWRCPTACAPRASRPGRGRPSTSARSPTAASSPATCWRSAPRVLLPAAAGRSLRGLFHDRHTGLVWAVGSLGAEAHVWAVDDTHAAPSWPTCWCPAAGFLNDLVITERAVWVTDSAVDRLTRIALNRRGLPRGTAPTFLTLGGDVAGHSPGGLRRQRHPGAVRRLARDQQQHRRRPVAGEPAHRRGPRDRRARRPAAGQW